MNTSRVIERRLRSHRLSAPAPTIAAAAAHMLATQGQEFWGGRWALAARTKGDPSVRDVDAAFDRGEIVRSWTMRGTIHVIPARDLAWVLSLTADRQHRSAAAVHRAEAIDGDELVKAERLAVGALAGGNRLDAQGDVRRPGGGRRLDGPPARLPPAGGAVAARGGVPGAGGFARDGTEPRAVHRAAPTNG